jgi:bifunctional non-homologous end joining protein LigD
MSKKQEVEVQGRILTLSNLEKVFYPASGFTKGQVIDYYTRVAPFMLPHLKDRPVTLIRYPDGVQGGHFYEKDAPAFTPEWVRTVLVPRRTGEKDIRYIVINDLPTLVWCANLAGLEIHPFLHRAPALGTPTQVVFDLDPGEGADILQCAEVAFLLKDLLGRLKLESFPKVSGSKGIQLYIPLNTRASYAATRPFARGLAEALEQQHPDRVVSEINKAARVHKVLIDWSQNEDFKTTVAVYSLRAKHAQPYVSLPVKWEELHQVLKRGNTKLLYFEPEAALKRLEKAGDLFEPLLRLKQKLPAAAKGNRARPGAKQAI